MTDLDQIKNKIDIAELIGQYVNLKRAGANFKGVCPFHEEKTPSMMVNSEKQIFKCFGCGEGGDIFTFIQKRENLEFIEALKLLADRAGVTLSNDRQPTIGADRKNRLYRVNKIISLLFHKLLMEHPTGKPALDYLLERGLNIETIKRFQLGWAPSQMGFLTELGRKKGFTDADLEAAGAPQRLYNRVTFPLRDTLGNVVGFSGRTLEAERQPKYLNTPDTIIFHKGAVLYDLAMAKDEIKKRDRTVLVEGQMDVLSSVQAGIAETVASSGTALTEQQLRILFRYSQNLTIAFDTDTAGVNATKRALLSALPIGFNVRIVTIAGGKDPGDVALKDIEAWQRSVDEAPDYLTWLWRVTLEQLKEKQVSLDLGKLDISQKRSLAKEIVPFIRLVDEPIAKEAAVRHLAELLRISTDTATELVERSTGDNPKPVDSVKPSEKLVEQPEWLLIGCLMHEPSLLNLVKDRIHLTLEGPVTLYKALLDVYSKTTTGSVSAKQLLEETKQQVGRELATKLDIVLLEIDESFDTTDPKTIEQIVLDITVKSTQTEREQLKQRFADSIRTAEASGSREDVKKLLDELGHSLR